MRYRFADCVLDIARHAFLRAGEEVPLEPQVFDLMTLLVSRAGDLVTRDEIVETVWGGRIVSEAAISSRINAVRRALGDDGARQAILRTLPRRGFRLEVAVETDTAEVRAASAEQHVRFAPSRDGTAIAWATAGNGPPLLRAGHFLTHLDFDRQSAIWRPLIDALEARFTLTRYDQRGTGMSDPDVSDFALDRLVEDLGSVADAAGLDRFPIFAASQGVPVSLAFAARNPDRVTRLVLYGGYAQGRSVRGNAEDRAQAEAILTFVRQGWGRAGSPFLQAFETTYMPDATTEQLAQMVELQRASATAETAAALRFAIDRFDVREILGEVKVPVLVLHAAEDAVHPLAQSRLIAAWVPGAELRVLPGRNHVPLPHDPAWQALVAETAAFLT
jgi:DNA-binding winged helix-turn-helix (wHTH) protein/alpha-beta hydrolase superfamily lysophospholipase